MTDTDTTEVIVKIPTQPNINKIQVNPNCHGFDMNLILNNPTRQKLYSSQALSTNPIYVLMICACGMQYDFTRSRIGKYVLNEDFLNPQQL